MMTSIPNPRFGQLASDDRIARAVEALCTNSIRTTVVQTGEDAREHVLSMLPVRAEVHLGASRTLDLIGLTAEIEGSGRYQAVRLQLRQIDRSTQGREYRKLASSPDFMLGSVHAVTELGQVLVASGGGSQIGPYAS